MTYRNGPIDERTILSNVVIKMHFSVNMKSENQYKSLSEKFVNKTCRRQHSSKIQASVSSTIYHNHISNKQNIRC